MMTLGSAVPVSPQNFVICHITRPHPYRGQFVHRLWLAHSTCTSNLKSLRSPRCIRQHKM